MISYGGIGSIDYYLKMQKEDYYTHGKLDHGNWLGRGSSALGLSGPVHPKTLERLFQGISPDGKQALVMNAGSPNRRPG